MVVFPTPDGPEITTSRPRSESFSWAAFILRSVRDSVSLRAVPRVHFTEWVNSRWANATMSKPDPTTPLPTDDPELLQKRIAQLEATIRAQRNEIKSLRQNQVTEELERRWQLLIGQVPAMIWTMDQDLVYTSCHGAGLKQLGLKPNELVGVPLHEYLGDRPEAGLYLSSHKRVREGERVSLTSTWMGRDYQIICEPLREESGRITGQIGIAFDITEQKVLERKLTRRVQFERLMIRISNHFIDLPAAELDQGIDEALGMVGQFVNVDRSYVFHYDDSTDTLSNTHEWCRDGISAERDSIQNAPAADFAWSVSQFRRGEAVIVNDVQSLPEEAVGESRAAAEQSIRSLLAIPLQLAGRFLGFCGFDMVREAREWSEEIIQDAAALADVFVHALERRQNQLEQQEQERFLSTLLGNLPGWVYRVNNDPDWTFLYVSDGIEAVTGVSITRFLQGEQSFGELMHPDDRAEVWETVQKALQDRRSFELKYRIRDAAGATKWLWERGLGVFDENNRLKYLEGFITDISQQHLNELELQKRDRDLQLILVNSPDVIVRYDLDLTILYVNPPAAAVFGMTEQELIGRPLCATPFSQRVVDDWTDYVRETARLGRDRRFEYETEIDGLMTCFDCHLVPEPNDNGEITSVLCLSRNITQRKQAERNLRNANSLQRLLLRELDHRVRNNLASLLALVDLSARDADSVNELADSIRSRVLAMSSVHDLLSRGHWTSLDLRGLMDSLLPADVASRVDVDGTPLPIAANQSTALGMVIQELIANSLKHGALASEEGTVTIHWSDEPADEEREDHRRLTINWIESGGPPVDATPPSGTGTGLIRGLVRSELHGTADLSYPPEGARHRFTLSLEPVMETLEQSTVGTSLPPH
ncbi:MAG: PAS domain S-box protein [Phycisphaerales bacterium]|nr:MAG: PAS domain S-box protein [Phycisphaerales bacterium]